MTYWLYTVLRPSWIFLCEKFEEGQYLLSTFKKQDVKCGDIVFVYQKDDKKGKIAMNGFVGIIVMSKDMLYNTKIKLFKDVNMNRYIVDINVPTIFDKMCKLQEIDPILKESPEYKSAISFLKKYSVGNTHFAPLSTLLGTTMLLALKTRVKNISILPIKNDDSDNTIPITKAKNISDDEKSIKPNKKKINKSKYDEYESNTSIIKLSDNEYESDTSIIKLSDDEKSIKPNKKKINKSKHDEYESDTSIIKLSGSYNKSNHSKPALKKHAVIVKKKQQIKIDSYESDGSSDYGDIASAFIDSDSDVGSDNSNSSNNSDNSDNESDDDDDDVCVGNIPVLIIPCNTMKKLQDPIAIKSHYVTCGKCDTYNNNQKELGLEMTKRKIQFVTLGECTDVTDTVDRYFNGRPCVLEKDKTGKFPMRIIKVNDVLNIYNQCFFIQW
jgi:hypothetical protein